MFKNKNNILLYLIFAVYACLTFVIGLNHEPWLDEAQSWLIARDCSFFDIMFTRCSYEGTPFLWFYILKVFILLGWSYEYIFVISWLFACLGVYLFIFKSNFSTIFKITIPFTFYIFYQYSIIARPYCLIFPALCLIAIFYNKRFERPFLYCGFLVILASIHAYAFVVAFILLCFYIYDVAVSRRSRSVCHSRASLSGISSLPFIVHCTSYIVHFRSKLFNFSTLQLFNCRRSVVHYTLYIVHYTLYIAIAVLCFAFIAFISMKNPDCDYVQKNVFLDGNIFEKIISALLRGYFNLDSFFSFLSAIIMVPALYYLSIKTFCVTKKQIIYFVMLNFAVYASMIVVNFYDWHLGVILFTLFFSVWILKNVNNIQLSFKNNTLFYIVCLTVIFAQIFFSVKNSYFEIYKEYDGAKTTANYIKENNFEKEKIIGLAARVSAVQPYFKQNIFVNKSSSYYHWSKRGFLDELANTKKLLPNANVFVVDEDMLKAILFEDIIKYVEGNFHEDITVKSDMYIKGRKFPSSTTYHIFVRNEKL